ncbi:MAG: S8 family serine peptidase [Candidatus Marinimicrobia bacterium]|nr:S8 family serine peptidase [Candidatus Neomarinimicrobiota bacterium]
MVRHKSILVLILFSLSLSAQTNLLKEKIFEGYRNSVKHEFPNNRVLLKANGANDSNPIISSELLNLIETCNSPVLETPEGLLVGSSQNGERTKTFESLVPIYIYIKNESEIETITPFLTGEYDFNAKFSLLSGYTTVKNLIELGKDIENIRHIRSILPPVTHAGSTTTEGDLVHRTDLVRSTYGFDGTGIKIGIISDGVDNRLTAQMSGDLPVDGAGLTVLSNALGGDEGTAMLEIVYDMVPGAELYFHDCGSNWNEFNDAIDALVSAGCNILCDDIGWLAVPFFEDGVIASHLESVINSQNIIYTSSAGNAGQSHHQSQFFPLSEYPNYHDFSGGTSSLSDMYCNLSRGNSISIVLQWNDPFGNSGNDYDLYLYSRKSDAIVASSTNIQNGNDDPLEFINYTANNTTAGDFEIWVFNSSASGNEIIEVFLYGNNYTNNTSPVDAIFGHSAANGVISCAAVFQGSPGSVEPFSSQGPSTIAYPSAESRQTPKITGVDGVSVTGAGGFPNPFYGTSAAAPHVAAVAAMIWSHDPGYTRDEVINMLYGSAVDLGASGFDNIYGFGRADAYSTYQDYSLPVELQNFTCYFDQGVVNIQWRTESELNNLGFIIEKKFNENWQQMVSFQNDAHLLGQGTSSIPTNYYYSDQAVISGSTYQYRLIDIDYNGNKTVHDDLIQTVSIPEKMEKSIQNFALNGIYPNPFNPSANISYQLSEESLVKVRVFNITGDLIVELINRKQSSGLHHITWNAANFAGGLYIVQISNEKLAISQKCLLLK